MQKIQSIKLSQNTSSVPLFLAQYCSRRKNLLVVNNSIDAPAELFPHNLTKNQSIERHSSFYSPFLLYLLVIWGNFITPSKVTQGGSVCRRIYMWKTIFTQNKNLHISCLNILLHFPKAALIGTVFPSSFLKAILFFLMFSPRIRKNFPSCSWAFKNLF